MTGRTIDDVVVFDRQNKIRCLLGVWFSLTQPTRKSPYDKKSTVNNNVIMQAYFLAVDCIGSGSIIFGKQTVHINEDIVNK